MSHVWSYTHPAPGGYDVGGTGGAWCQNCGLHYWCGKNRECPKPLQVHPIDHDWSYQHPAPGGYDVGGTGGAWCKACGLHYWCGKGKTCTPKIIDIPPVMQPKKKSGWGIGFEFDIDL